jgi:hypothetical protein
MEEENTKQISYNDLDDNLKDQVRENFRDDEYLVPDDWYHWVLEDLGENEKWKGIDLDEDSLEFDMYRGSMSIKGSIDLDEVPFKKHLTDNYHLWDEKEWFYDFPTNFEDYTLDDSYYVQRDIIFEEMEEEIFNGEELIVENGEMILTSSLIKPMKEAFNKYSTDFPDETQTLKEWINELEAAMDIFFQDEITISEEVYDTFMEDITTEMERKIESELEEIQEAINGELEEFYDSLKNNLQSSYDYYYTDEYADANLEDRTFEVEVDEDENQLEVLDLNGEW